MYKHHPIQFGAPHTCAYERSQPSEQVGYAPNSTLAAHGLSRGRSDRRKRGYIRICSLFRLEPHERLRKTSRSSRHWAMSLDCSRPIDSQLRHQCYAVDVLRRAEIMLMPFEQCLSHLQACSHCCIKSPDGDQPFDSTLFESRAAPSFQCWL